MSKIIGVTVGTTMAAPDAANSLKGKAEGSAVTMTDVSPLEHNIGVRLASKNVLNIDTVTGSWMTKGNDGSFTQSKDDTRANLQLILNAYKGNEYVKRLQNPIDVLNTGKWSCTFECDGTFDFLRFGHNGSTTNIMCIIPLPSFPNDTYTFSVNLTNVTQGSFSWKDMQIELGTTATAYTPFLPLQSTTTRICNMAVNGTDYNFASGEVDYIVSSVAEDISSDSGMVHFKDGSYCDCWWGSVVVDYIPSVGDVIRYDGEDIYLVEQKGLDSVTLTKWGKNLLDSNIFAEVFDLQEDGSYLSNQKIGVKKYQLELPKGIYTYSLWVKCANGENYRPRIYYEDDTYLENNVIYTGDYVYITGTTNGKAIKEIGFYYSASTDNLSFKDFQIEYGTTATEYEPFKEPKTYNGTVESVPSLYPTTTLLTDTEGVTITAEYNKDLNKAFEELKAQLQALILEV